jgi:hypothetical protein
MPDGEKDSLLPKKVYFRLLSDLNHRLAQRRSAALKARHEARDPRAPGPASRRLFDADGEVRELASVVLEGWGLGAPARAVLDLFDHGESARGAAVSALASTMTAPMPAPHVGVIAATAAGLHELYDAVAAAAATHDERYVRRAAVEGLYQVNQGGLAPAFLIPSTDVDPGVRRYAAVGLAENGILTGSGRLCRDVDGQVAKAARTAFSRPGTPILVRDAHRRVMERSESFSLPTCGAALMPSQAFPRLEAEALELLSDPQAFRAEAALLTLLLLGRPREALRGRLPAEPHARLVARLVDRPEADSAKAVAIREPNLEGRRILVVGGDGVEGPVLGALRATGLEVDWLSGFDNAASRKSYAALQAVLVLTSRVSHAVAEHAARIGDESGAVVVHVSRIGQAAVIDAARDALETGGRA